MRDLFSNDGLYLSDADKEVGDALDGRVSSKESRKLSNCLKGVCRFSVSLRFR